jgi:hypothetical protein
MSLEWELICRFECQEYGLSILRVNYHCFGGICNQDNPGK